MGSFVLLGFTYANRKIFEYKVRGTNIYKKALEILRNHKQSVQYLEEPIKEGRIRILNTPIDVRKFSVDLKGVKGKGTLHCECLRHEPTNIFQINKLILELANDLNESFVILENYSVPTV